MADRVHPGDSPPAAIEATTTQSENPSTPAPQPPEKNIPPPGTYVIRVPRDRIYRYPPPENAHRFQNYTRRKARRSCCRRCLCWVLTVTALVLVLLAIAAGVLYLVFRPEAPEYSVDDIAVGGFNLTASSSITPEFDVTYRARNPNDKISIHYQRGSSVKIYYSDIDLSNGNIPAFRQPSNNVTALRTALRGSTILLTSSVRSAMMAEQRRGRIPFRLNLRAPVRMRLGAVKTWKITVKLNCHVTVDNLTAESKIVSKDCDYGVRLWW